MAEFALGLGGLSAGQREQVARHYEQTRHMCYGGRERQAALVFRLPYDSPEVASADPEAAFLAGLAAAARESGTVRPPKMDKAARVRMSELLRQSADRASREARDDTVTREMTRLWREWDAAWRVPADEAERAEWVQLPRRTLAI